jgi:hypothetical protein
MSTCRHTANDRPQPGARTARPAVRGRGRFVCHATRATGKHLAAVTQPGCTLTRGGEKPTPFTPARRFQGRVSAAPGGCLERYGAGRFQMGSSPDQGVRDLAENGRPVSPGADGSDQGEDADAVQHELFAGSSVFGTVVGADFKSVPTGGRGRPKGSRSRSTQQLIKLISETGRHPVLAMAEIVSTPIDAIARTLGCTKLEAAEYHRKVMSDLAPYVAQRLPQAVQISGANAGMLMINLGGNMDEALRGLDMKVVDHVADDATEDEENQEVSGDDGATSHEGPSHDEDK